MNLGPNKWKNYRNRWVFLKGKKVKLRKYIYANSAYMRFRNKKGWAHVNHVQNYKNALNKYGFSGLKIYEDFFYNDVPLPENRSLYVRISLFLVGVYVWFKDFKINK
jgi:hypothetical protein